MRLVAEAKKRALKLFFKVPNDKKQFINRKNNVFHKKGEIFRTPSNFTRLNVKNILRPMYPIYRGGRVVKDKSPKYLQLLN